MRIYSLSLLCISIVCSYCRLIRRPNILSADTVVSPGKLKGIHSVIIWAVSQSVLRHRVLQKLLLCSDLSLWLVWVNFPSPCPLSTRYQSSKTWFLTRLILFNLFWYLAVVYSDLTHSLVHKFLVSHSHFVVQYIIPDKIRLREMCSGFLATLPNGIRLPPSSIFRFNPSSRHKRIFGSEQWHISYRVIQNHMT
jgi:hypothetical protein